MWISREGWACDGISCVCTRKAIQAEQEQWSLFAYGLLDCGVTRDRILEQFREQMWYWNPGGTGGIARSRQ